MLKKNITLLLLVFLLFDLSYSFIQYYQTPLYGEIANGVIIGKEVKEIFNDPLGFNAVKTEAKHINPNRFFSHFSLRHYFLVTPHFLQKMVNPVSSVYLSAAIAKILVQLLFVYTISVLICGSYNPIKKRFILAAVLIIPLFQSYGYWSRMGINDKSIVYTFFYGIPLVLTMLFLLPILNAVKYKTKPRPFVYILLAPFIVILPLSGPLIPAVFLLLGSFLFFYFWQKSGESIKSRTLRVWKNLPFPIFILLFPSVLWSFYSLYLGKFDSNYASSAIPIIERYKNLPAGIFNQLFHSLGFPLMLGFIIVNVFLIKRLKNKDTGKVLLTTANWIGIFATAYILLLPLGGYRPYRPLIIRYDTIMPITTALIYFFGNSTFYLLKELKGKPKKHYLSAVVVVLLIFSITDLRGLNRNACERRALEEMAATNDSIIAIPKDCLIMSWDNIYDYKLSEQNAELIYFWGISTEKKLFYNMQK